MLHRVDTHLSELVSSSFDINYNSFELNNLKFKLNNTLQFNNNVNGQGFVFV